MYENIERKLHDIGNGLFAWVQGDGSWGWSNSGLICGDDDKVVMVDTLFTGRLTQDVLDAYRRAVPAADVIDVLINSHSNGDHTYGNHLVEGARIIGSTACLEEMQERPASLVKEVVAAPEKFGTYGKFFSETMGSRFDFSDVGHLPPNETFDGTMALTVGGRQIELTELGPAHTRGDIVIHVPDARTVYTGDVVFHGGHPIIWAGPIGNWIAACDFILGLDIDVVVPGHGAICGKPEVQALRDYLVSVQTQASKAYAAGLTWTEAAWEVGYAAFDSWLDRERVVANVANVYKELSGGAVDPTREEIMAQMLRYRHGAECAHDGPCACHAKAQ
ncbi:MBL fold metallo-hydrolase [Pseudooceanicola sp.]|uniref:MBL fold metallo-hydrolase n=1 Tax=Pseudooceanicola sp. TaxID=1914328 RepID=UPI0026306AC6|nr:MBL fold metallo-hydrolase [Pseudooceanicola sp.]MDF1854068.1 MBL fold metallo-hydrolase [Pseudooceanicola sp.]